MAERAQQRSSGRLLVLTAGVAAISLAFVALWAVWPGGAVPPSETTDLQAAIVADAAAADDGGGAVEDGGVAPTGAIAPQPLGSAVLAGVVVDEGGAPVAGARIDLVTDGPDGVPLVAGEGLPPDPRLEPSGELGILRGPIPFPPPAPLALPPELPAVRSDERGAFRVGGLPAGRVVVTAAHPRAGRATSDPIELGDGRGVEVRLVLKRGETIAGRVTDERDLPIAGVEILLDDKIVALTDARGQYRLDDVTHDVTLAPRKAGWAGEPRTVALAERRDLWSIDFRLRAVEARLDGVVLDERGVGLPGARVALVEKRGPRVVATTDRGGVFRVEGLGGERHRLEITHPDFAPRVVEAAAGREEVRITLEPGGGVDGVVRDATSGRPPARISVVVRAGGREQALAVDRAGRFSGWGVPAGTVTLEARAPGYATVAKELTVAAATRPREITLRDVELVIERAARVRARVVDGRGDPVAGAVVVIGARRATTDARGEAVVDGVAPGRVRAVVGGVQSEEIDLRPDETANVEIRTE
jgi:protocatechuate 3,4-dioxygenase beta subunit